MFEVSVKKVDFEKNNFLIKRNINLAKELDCFLLISSKDSNFTENLLNNSLEYLIDKISENNTYNDFSIALEWINSFIKAWKKDNEKKLGLKMTIWLLHNKTYYFSNIWKSSLCMINKNSEVISLTSKKDKNKEFNYVSSWELVNWEIIISSTNILLDFLSKSDLVDWLVLSQDIKIFNKNIKNILSDEILDENILVSSLMYKSDQKEIEKINLIKHNFFKILDNDISKKIIAYFLIIKEKILQQSKMVKNILFLSWITIAICILFVILSNIISTTTQSQKLFDAETEKNKIKNYVMLASENIANIETFEKNITNAEVLIKKLEEEEVFLDDLTKITENINILKKQFNKIETFSPENLTAIFWEEIESPVKIIKNESKTYIVTEKSIIWPILTNIKAKKYIFTDLDSDEIFVDSSFIWTSMYLLTNKSKIVKFTKNWHFSFADVSWQKIWEQSKNLDTYWQNLYLVTDTDQINKHPLSWNTFKTWIGYLKEDDQKQIWEILSIAIDWGFYILKKDLSVVKFFSKPYRLESIILNKLPKNYNHDENTKIELKARANLNYVYLLMNNKIWVFQTNTKNFQNTQSLTYVWQIDWWVDKIEDFFVNYDWEVLILNTKWLYKLNFEVSDDKIILR